MDQIRQSQALGAFSLLARAALVDGQLASCEARLLGLYARRAGLSIEAAQARLDSLRGGAAIKIKAAGAGEAVEKLNNVAIIVVSDGYLDPAERELLARVAGIFQLGEVDVHRAIAVAAVRVGVPPKPEGAQRDEWLLPRRSVRDSLRTLLTGNALQKRLAEGLPRLGLLEEVTPGKKQQVELEWCYLDGDELCRRRATYPLPSLSPEVGRCVWLSVPTARDKPPLVHLPGLLRERAERAPVATPLRGAGLCRFRRAAILRHHAVFADRSPGIPAMKKKEPEVMTNVVNTDDIRKILEEDEKRSRQKKGYFFVISGPLAGQMFKLDEPCIELGRSATAQIRLDDDGVSRNHARVVAQDHDGALVIEDAGSTNGTFVNGSKVQSKVLVDGDRIQIGATSLLKFSYQDSDEEAFQQRLYESAIRDGLTGAFNKRYFQGLLQTEFAFALRHNVPLSLVIFDLDHFKRINDSYGHPAGDAVLKTLVTVVAHSLRQEDLVSRYGGEEFTALLRQTDTERARLCAERIREAVANHSFVADGKKIRVTVSLGVATLKNQRYAHPEDFIKAADRCLYAAKRGGRNRWVSDETQRADEAMRGGDSTRAIRIDQGMLRPPPPPQA